MGWTGKFYNETSHLEFDEANACEILSKEYNSSQNHVVAFYLEKAKTPHHHNVIYTAFEKNDGTRFLCNILVDIVDNEILTKDVTESMGPIQTNCPIYLLKLAPNKHVNQFAKDFRNNIKRKNLIKTPNTFIFNKLF